MFHRSLIAISASVLCVAAGVTLGHVQPQWAALGTSIAIAGGAAASVVLALAAAALMIPARRGTDAADRAMGRLTDFADELAAHAATACDKGILLLASARPSRHAALFDEGARMLVRADTPANMRTSLATLAEHQLDRTAHRRAASVNACRLLPVVAASAALAGVLYLVLLVTRGEAIGTVVPAAVLLAVYGAFGVMVVAAQTAQRLQAEALEHELSAQLVIETLARLREGDSPAQIRAALERLLRPGAEPARFPKYLRRAA